MTIDIDVLIVGGGLVGGSLALALRDQPLKIGLVEALSTAERAASTSGDRALALSRGTVQQLKALGLWPEVAANSMAIRHIHVSDQGHFGKTRLKADDPGVEALGHVVVARVLEKVLDQQLAESQIQRFCPARVMSLKAGPDRALVALREGDNDVVVSARLVVAADGGTSTVRSLLGIQQEIHDYDQTAIVTDVHTEEDTRHTAFERFTPSGPLALLPLEAHRCSVVWTLGREDAEEVLRQGDKELTARLREAFGFWLGDLTLANPPVGFPLRLIQAESMVHQRVVLIGNAMHQIHPVAGQGFNLGLRDAAVLADRLLTQHRLGKDIGDPDFLHHYARARQEDLKTVIRFTDGLVKVFSNTFPPLVALRNLALVALDRLPPAKRLLTRRAMGYGIRLS